MLCNAQASVDAVNYAVTNLYRPGAPTLPLSKLDMCTDKQPKLSSSAQTSLQARKLRRNPRGRSCNLLSV